MDLKTPKEVVKKSAYVAVGAPVVVARKMKAFGNKMMADAQTQIDEYAVEGEKVTKQLKERNVVEELEARMNIDKVQGRVEQLRDQLENTLNNWRESFAPETEKKVEEPKKAPAKKAPAAKKAPVAKKAPAKKAPAKKAPAAKKTAAATK
jgi:hypothetical protein